MGVCTDQTKDWEGEKGPTKQQDLMGQLDAKQQWHQTNGAEFSGKCLK